MSILDNKKKIINNQLNYNQIRYIPAHSMHVNGGA